MIEGQKTASELREAVTGLKRNYQMVFDKESVYTDQVLQDLARFCRANDSTFDQDPRNHALLEGRRQVWLRIQEHLNLSVEELFNLKIVSKI